MPNVGATGLLYCSQSLGQYWRVIASFDGANLPCSLADSPTEDKRLKNQCLSELVGTLCLSVD